MSILLTTTTIFLPHSRICSRKARSLSVNGRSAEVTNSTRSELGTNSRVIASWWRSMALVPGVSTMLISRSSSQRRRHHLDAAEADRALHRLAVLEQVDVGGGGGDPLFEELLAEQGVDEGAFAGVELAGHHQQEQLVEPLDRRRQRLLVLRRRVEPRQRRLQLAEQPPVLGQELFLRAAEDTLDHEGRVEVARDDSTGGPRIAL